jgi:ABC-2 type transport system permease protein
MRKYLGLFKISFEQEFVYRLNFVMWRVRNILQILVAYFLWTTLFIGRGEIFGYNQNQILTYIFGVLIVRALVLSSRAIDVSGEIASGDLTLTLLKPINFFKYWLTRDFSSKALNLFFAFFETLFLVLILRVPFFFQTNFSFLLLFSFSLILAILIFFFLTLLIDMFTFWVPEMEWAGQFIFIVIITEFLSGAIFPLDILPQALQKVIYLLPFPYLIFFPVQIYLGKLTLVSVLGGMMVEGFWVITLGLIVNFMWKKGLLRYEAAGR